MAANAAAAAAALPAGPPAVVVQFALSPALCTPDAVIDYSTSGGAKLFASSTKALPTEYDLKPEGLKLFLSQINDRSRVAGWSDILEIPVVLGAVPDVTVNLISQYGVVTMVQVRAHAESYNAVQCRTAQDTNQLYLCLMNSLTAEAQAKVSLRVKEYTFDEEKYVSGTCLLKIVIMESSIDTNATCRHIRERLGDLDAQMETLDSDIGLFNDYVNGLTISLQARGEITMDLLPNLFKGYKKASDQVFVTYIGKKQDDYDDGIVVTSASLMAAAKHKWRTMVEEGTWKAPSADSAKIIALEAQVKSLSKAKVTPKAKGDTKKPGDKGSPNKKKKDKKPDPEWMSKAPPEGQTTKTINGSEWTWCATHLAWGKHTDLACNVRLAAEAKAKAAGKSDAKSDTKALKISKALAAIANADDSDSA